MFKDQMTPVERRKALAEGREADRLPIGIIYGLDAHRHCGWVRSQELADGRSMAMVQKRLYQKFHLDGLGAGHGLHGLGLLYGAEHDMPEHAAISLLSFPLEKAAQVERLDSEKATLKGDKLARNCFECLEILREDLGQEVGCGMSFAAPFTAASGLLGPEKLLMGLLTDTENIHKLLDFATRAIISLATPFWQAGFGTSLADPLATGDVLSPRAFRSFAQPYARRVVEAAKPYGQGLVSVHICGDTSRLLKDVVDCGYSAFSVDNVVKLAKVKKEIGESIPISGNVDPINVMLLGSPEQVRAAVRRCFAAAWDSPRGFTISTGCDCAYGTPDENLLAYLDEARICAAYQYRRDPGYFLQDQGS